jgi:hypothetical protein
LQLGSQRHTFGTTPCPAPFNCKSFANPCRLVSYRAIICVLQGSLRCGDIKDLPRGRLALRWTRLACSSAWLVLKRQTGPAILLQFCRGAALSDFQCRGCHYIERHMHWDLQDVLLYHVDRSPRALMQVTNNDTSPVKHDPYTPHFVIYHLHAPQAA